MELTITVLLWVLAALLVAGGLLGLVLPAIPGPVLIFAGLALAAWIEDFTQVGTAGLIALGLMAALALLIDFVAGIVGARRYGASPRAVAWAALGAVAGLFFGLPGVLLGPFVGAVLGELSARRGLSAAARSGWGTALGLVLGIAGKLALGFAMIGLFVILRLL
jgi:uncharacterized protein YqgC (DUF456 family)